MIIGLEITEECPADKSLSLWRVIFTPENLSPNMCVCVGGGGEVGGWGGGGFSLKTVFAFSRSKVSFHEKKPPL